jgi:hypothetical protein
MNLRKLLRLVEIASCGSPELDSEFAAVFPSAPRKVINANHADDPKYFTSEAVRRR